MWELLAQASPVSPQDLGGWFGAWAVALTLCLAAIAWLTRRLAKSDARNEALGERIPAILERIIPLAEAQVDQYERIERLIARLEARLDRDQ